VRRVIPKYLRTTFFAVFLLVLSIIAFGRVAGFEFLHLDDDLYVWNNPHINQGISMQGLAWALSADLLHDSPHADYWQPVTMFSRMVDFQLFGSNAGAHHLMNLFYHALCGLLLFHLLIRLQPSVTLSFFVAAIFLVHPIQTESVAWVTERKDLLGTLFGFASLIVYFQFTKKSQLAYYFLALFLFAISLMSKPLLVTLPLLLLLFDLWPLKRITSLSWTRRIAEKLPFLLLALGSTVITWTAQRDGVNHVDALYLLAEAPKGYFWYAWKFFLPMGLGLRSSTTMTELDPLSSLAAILALSLIAWLLIRSYKHISFSGFGLAWFILTLPPFIIQNPLADRFMYFPHIGLSIWACSQIRDHLLPRLPVMRQHVHLGFGMIGMVAMAVGTNQASVVWKNDRTLFEHAVKVSPANWLAHNNLGALELKLGRSKEAVAHLRSALELKPDHVDAWANLGLALSRLGDLEGSVRAFEKTLKLRPDQSEIHYAYGLVLFQNGRLQEAKEHFHQCITLTPHLAKAWYYQGFIAEQEGDPLQAAMYYQKATQWNPRFKEAFHQLGTQYLKLGDKSQAVESFNRALAIDHGFLPSRDAVSKLAQD
jgi:protein O-mannosyl-transferase